MTDGSPGFLTLNRFLRERFGERVQKIPIDAGFTCPNRDGTRGRGGCIYCDAHGSGTGRQRFAQKGIAGQVREGMAWAERRYGARKFIAYFQSFSNTYAPLDILERRYREALVSPEIVGLSIGTRPDCIDRERLELISRVAGHRMVIMEYGLQSASDKTLRRINRGHRVRDFIDAVRLTREYGFHTCAHVIFGLPGQSREEMLDTAGLLAELAVGGVKFHQLYVVEGTQIHDLYEKGEIRLLDQDYYAEAVAESIKRLPPDTVIHRLAGDPPKEGFVGPGWSLDKAGTVRRIRRMVG